MDKQLLIEELNNVRHGYYSWALYFFKIDRRNVNPYTAYKVRFKNSQYLPAYAKAVVDMVVNYQLEKVDNINDYTGENAKISCDKIETSNELVKEQWNYLVNDIINSSDEKVEGKYNGYILEGTPLNNEGSNIICIKLANPIIKLKNKRSSVFTFDSNSELAELSDEVCKLHMDVDCIVINEVVYSFNYKIEDLFNMEKTMQKIKNNAIDDIIAIDAFDNKAEFEKIARSYKSPRTFITLKTERVEYLKKKTKRRDIAKTLKIDVNNQDKFMFKDDEEVSRLIRYLCYKLIKDDETKELLEANNVTQVIF